MFAWSQAAASEVENRISGSQVSVQGKEELSYPSGLRREGVCCLGGSAVVRLEVLTCGLDEDLPVCVVDSDAGWRTTLAGP